MTTVKRTLFRVYLTAYFLLIATAALTLWRTGVLARIDRIHVVAAAIVAVGLGLLLAAVSHDWKSPT